MSHDGGDDDWFFVICCAPSVLMVAYLLWRVIAA